MTPKTIPFTKEQILEIKKEYPTPFHLYDEKSLRHNAEKFRKAFSILPGFKEFFAVKATPNPFILKIFREYGFGSDCSSLAELIMSQKVGIVGENIMFSSNDTPLEDFAKAKELGAIMNLDDISHIDFVGKNLGLSSLISFRYNPGPERTGNVIIGDPKEAKYGFTKQQLMQGYEYCKKKGVKRFGLHTMVASNELDPQSFVETARMLFTIAIDVKQKLGISLEFINLGGGIGIPYRPEQQEVDYDVVATGIKTLHDEMLGSHGLGNTKIFMECGRALSGPYDFLITTVLHLKHIYKDYVGCDACMANLMRPGMYGAYHHITVLGKENKPHDKTYDVTGSLCENNDKFAIDRKLPQIESGDILAIHDAGAHGHAMGFNYNGKLRSAELLLRTSGEVMQIRRAETVDDYFATLDFEKAQRFS